MDDVTGSPRISPPMRAFLFGFATVDFDRSADLDPFVEELCRIPMVEVHANAAFGCGIVRHGFEPVNEVVAVILYAVGHRGPVEELGIMLTGLVGASLIFSHRGAVSSAADVAVENEALSLPASEALGGEVDFSPLRSIDEKEFLLSPGDER